MCVWRDIITAYLDRYIGKKVNILYTGTTVDIYIKYEKIASYARNHKPYGYTYQEEHLASSQRVLTDWNPEEVPAGGSIHTR